MSYEIKNRIATVKSIGKNVSVMKLISVSRLKNLKDSLSVVDAFIRDELNVILCKFFQSEHCSSLLKMSSFMYEPISDSRIIILITSNRGLCGSYNSGIKNKFKKIAQSGDKLICIGQKGLEFISRYFPDLEIIYSTPISTERDASPSLEMSNRIAEIAINECKKNKIPCFILSSSNINAVSVEQEFEQIMPLNAIGSKFIDTKDDILKNSSIGQFVATNLATFDHGTDSNSTMFETFCLIYIEYLIYNKLLNSLVSEENIRAVSMEGAHRNAEEMIHKLDMEYNRARQSKITNEIAEVINSSESI